MTDIGIVRESVKRKAPKVHWGTLRSRLIELVLLIIILVVALGPFYWIATSSLKSTYEIYDPVPSLFPQRFVLDHYQTLVIGTKYPYFLLNSLSTSIATVILTLVVASMAAYALHRPAFRGKALLSRLILISYMFPGILLLVPLHQMFSKLGLIDNLITLPIVVVTFTTPMSTWLLASFFHYIPYEVEESALLDGASRVRVLTHVIIPLLKPGLAAVGIYAFIVAWGEYMFASVLINTELRKTLPVGLSTLIDQYRLDWGLLAAGATAITIPVILLFALMGRRFVEGLISGSVKG
jgi:multiple sugar transport system permease protein